MLRTGFTLLNRDPKKAKFGILIQVTPGTLAERGKI